MKSLCLALRYSCINHKEKPEKQKVKENHNREKRGPITQLWRCIKQGEKGSG